MPNWDQLEAYVRANLKLLRDDGRGLWLGWQSRSDDGQLDRQAVHISSMTAYREPWIVLVAEVGPDSLLSQREALQLNAELTIGALALYEGHYGLRCSLNIKNLPIDDIILFSERLALAAVEIRKRLTQPIPPAKSATLQGYWSK
ncbi:MAG: hypothetical protein JNJ46_08475 [Myxococcales bacterium]|jgi:hypothetical protein|nr:hypothetical protein [Myxococcales bacterium]